MTESVKHTPGPWKLGGPTGYGDINGHRVKDRRGYILAVAIGDIPELPSEANARLISTAPELLDYARQRAATGCPMAAALVAKAEALPTPSQKEITQERCPLCGFFERGCAAEECAMRPPFAPSQEDA